MANTTESKNLVSPFDLVEIIEFNYLPRFQNKKFLHEEYVLKKKTCQEIADQICCSRSTLLKYLHEYDIPTRERFYAKRSKKTAYGKEIKNYALVDVKEELKRIEDVKRLRANEFSYRKIAEVFNALGVATKSGTAKWTGKTIHQIINTSKE